MLVQVILALAPFHLLLNAATNALFDFNQVDLTIKSPEQQLNTGADIQRLQQFLLLMDLQLKMSRHGVRQSLQIVDSGQRVGDF